MNSANGSDNPCVFDDEVNYLQLAASLLILPTGSLHARNSTEVYAVPPRTETFLSQVSSELLKGGKKMKRIIIIIVIVCNTFYSNIGSATSWVELDPQQVINRAEVIVIGEYDVSPQTSIKSNNPIFLGLKFNVTKVLRGTAPNQITAGIDRYDVGWVEEFQNSGGQFLLFLEKREEDDFLVPVGGPNGMIQVKDGVIIQQSDSSVFGEFLKMDQLHISEETKIESETTHVNSDNLLSKMAIGILFLTIPLIFFVRRKKNLN